MLDWLKFKKKQAPKGQKPLQGTQPVASVAPPQPVAQTREEIVAMALKNMQETREIIGEERLQKLAQLILQKKQSVDDTSPAAQAKKIIARMDKTKLDGFMKLMVQDDQTKH